MDVPQAFSTKTTNVLGGQLKTPASPLYKTCLAILITAALTACGSSSSGDDDAAATLEDAVGEPEDTSDTPSAPGTDTPSAPATDTPSAVSYTHLRAHETGRNLVCRLLLEKKNI